MNNKLILTKSGQYSDIPPHAAVGISKTSTAPNHTLTLQATHYQEEIRQRSVADLSTNPMKSPLTKEKVDLDRLRGLDLLEEPDSEESLPFVIERIESPLKGRWDPVNWGNLLFPRLALFHKKPDLDGQEDSDVFSSIGSQARGSKVRFNHEVKVHQGDRNNTVPKFVPLGGDPLVRAYRKMLAPQKQVIKDFNLSEVGRALKAEGAEMRIINEDPYHLVEDRVKQYYDERVNEFFCTLDDVLFNRSAHQRLIILSIKNNIITEVVNYCDTPRELIPDSSTFFWQLKEQLKSLLLTLLELPENEENGRQQVNLDSAPRTLSSFYRNVFMENFEKDPYWYLDPDYFKFALLEFLLVRISDLADDITHYIYDNLECIALKSDKE